MYGHGVVVLRQVKAACAITSAVNTRGPVYAYRPLQAETSRVSLLEKSAGSSALPLRSLSLRPFSNVKLRSRKPLVYSILQRSLQARDLSDYTTMAERPKLQREHSHCPTSGQRALLPGRKRWGSISPANWEQEVPSWSQLHEALTQRAPQADAPHQQLTLQDALPHSFYTHPTRRNETQLAHGHTEALPSLLSSAGTSPGPAEQQPRSPRPSQGATPAELPKFSRTQSSAEVTACLTHCRDGSPADWVRNLSSSPSPTQCPHFHLSFPFLRKTLEASGLQHPQQLSQLL